MFHFDLPRHVRRCAWLAAIVPILAGCGPYAIDHIDFPGANFTEAWGINNKHEIVGIYSLPGGPLAQHSFIRDASGHYTNIDFPGSNDTHAYKINNDSQ